MPRYLKRYLLLSSVLWTLCSCVYRHYPSPNPSKTIILDATALQPVVPADGSSVKYKASIDVLNKHFSGILLLKQIDSTQHVVFVTELGMKMFDFEMRGGHFSPVYVFEPLNKPTLVGVLEKDLELMLLLDLVKQPVICAEAPTPKNYVRLAHDKNTSVLEREGTTALRRWTFFKKRKETRTLFTYKDGAYQGISLKQYGLVKLYIDLTKLNDG